MAWARTGSRAFAFLFLLNVLSLSSSSLELSSHPAPLLASTSHSHGRPTEVSARKFWIAHDMFWKDDQPFQIIGGDLHYFRVHPEYWKDRLLRAKALGLNAIQTYVPWNLHEPLPKQWTFKGVADLKSFLKTSQDLGLLVMLRVGPYICGEWDLGGFPAWLLAVEPSMTLRSSDPAFLRLVERWWDVLLPMIAPFLYENGGHVIMVQIENEFGSFGDDQVYLRHLVSLARSHLGDEIILYTTDGGTLNTLEKGTILGDKIFSAVDFSTGEDAWSIFEMQKMFNAPGKSPPLSAEFYTGWLTHWGEPLAKTDAMYTATELQKILSRNGSAVLYMAHGGTNFGFFSGANTVENASGYRADLTSYDYDAPIEESGDVDNLKFKALRAVIGKFSREPLPPLPSNNRRTGYGHVVLDKIASLFEVLDFLCDPDKVVESRQPFPMESVGQMFGFLLYLSEYTPREHESTLSIPEVHDRAQVFVTCAQSEIRGNPTYVDTVERWSNREISLPKLQCPANISLFILVENLGRVNYGPYIYDRKGILSDVILDGTVLKQWKMFPISFDNLDNFLPASSIVEAAESVTDFLAADNNCRKYVGIPGFYEGRFTIDPIKRVNDTFITLQGWTKGIVFVNNFNIGRYWPSIGPQCTLYIPAPVLHHGENKVVVLELHNPKPELNVDLIEHSDFSCGTHHRL